MITSIYIGTDKLDLFKDDNIVIKSKVSDIEDITKIFTDTSNSFNVPANDRNNAIFKHYYESKVVNGFDARKKQPAVIELYGSLYKVGKIRLNKVKMKSNAPSSYDIDFFGNLVKLKDLLSDDKLSDLDFSSYDFLHDYTNVAQRLTFEGDTIMSLFSNKRYIYDSSNPTITDDKITNVYFNGVDSNTGVRYNTIKASIKTLRVIEAIESEYNLTFSRDFFGGNEFGNLYMLLSGRIVNGFEEIIPIVNTSDPTVVGNVLLAGSEPGTIRIEYAINIDSGFSSIPYKIIAKSDGEQIYEQDFTGDNHHSLHTINYTTFEKITFHIIADEPIKYTFSIERFYTFFANYNSNTPLRIMVSNYSVADNMPDLKVIDFLKGMFKLYKLIAIVQNDGSVYIDSLTNYYRKGKVHNVDKYIDYKSHTVTRGKVLNEIKYNFEEPTTILNDQFEENNDGVGYGDLELAIYDDSGNLIDGESLDYKVPFEQIVYERLTDIDGVDEVGIQYALLANDLIDPVKPKAHLHYNYNTHLGSNPLKIITDADVGAPIFTLNMPMHTLGIESPVFSTVFGEEFNEYTGNLITETIFKTHHQAYIEGVFSSKRRVYSFTAKNLPINIIQDLRLNDVLEIREDYYRIDSMDTNIITGEVKFKLLNAINLDLTPLVSVSWDRVDITWDNIEITFDNI